jgi:outer membrane protein OmpA-like peptidoglycan-associated protein
MENILEIARSAFAGNTIDQAASWLQESPQATKRGLEAAVPTALSGLAEHASDRGNAENLLGLLKSEDHPRLEPGDIAAVVSDPSRADALAESSSGVLSRIWPRKQGEVVQGLALHAGISRASSAKVLGIATPLVLAMIGKRARASSLDGTGLSRYISEQAKLASPFMPGGGAPGEVVENIERKGRETRYREQNEPRFTGTGREEGHVQQRGARASWLIAALAGIALLSFFVMKNRSEEGAPRTTTAQVPKEKPGAAQPGVQDLSDAAGLSALTRYLSSGDPNPQRFTVGAIQFKQGSSSIAPNKVLDEIATNLGTRPTARTRIEAGSDASGNPAKDEALAQARADAVKSYLVEHGVSAGQIEAHGVEAPSSKGGRVEMVVTNAERPRAGS